jgi:Na+-transporting NADH:ubiquinone oxidoreductase subunit A
MDGSHYTIKKGLDLQLEGVAAEQLFQQQVDGSGTYAIVPDDFHGITPRLLVKEGVHVEAGEALFTDKATGAIHVVSPVSGNVVAIARGERRKLLHIGIEADKHQTFKEYAKPDVATISADAAIQGLAECGLFAFIRQRPYDVIATPTDRPKALFVSTFNKMPLAARFAYTVIGWEREFRSGLQLLARIAPLHLGIAAEEATQPFAIEAAGVEGVTVHTFDGPNPAGNVGVQINHISPINKGEIAWTVDPGIVCLIGRYVTTGHVDLTRRIALAGSCIDAPQYIETKIGTPLSAIADAHLKGDKAHIRIIGGNPLVGSKKSLEGYLPAFATEVCAIPEGDDVNEVFGWIAPRWQEFSTSHSYCSWIRNFFAKCAGRVVRYNPDCRVKGGERHMIMSGEYERVFPMDIYPSYLIKALLTGDIDKQEALGIYEVAPEDFAVAEFIDSSKLELQRIVREGLDLLRKENA